MVNSSFKKSKNKQKKYNKMNKEQNNKEKNKSTNNIELNNKVLLEIEQIKEKENLIFQYFLNLVNSNSIVKKAFYNLLFSDIINKINENNYNIDIQTIIENNYDIIENYTSNIFNNINNNINITNQIKKGLLLKKKEIKSNIKECNQYILLLKNIYINIITESIIPIKINLKLNFDNKKTLIIEDNIDNIILGEFIVRFIFVLCDQEYKDNKTFENLNNLFIPSKFYSSEKLSSFIDENNNINDFNKIDNIFKYWIFLKCIDLLFSRNSNYEMLLNYDELKKYINLLSKTKKTDEQKKKDEQKKDEQKKNSKKKKKKHKGGDFNLNELRRKKQELLNKLKNNKKNVSNKLNSSAIEIIKLFTKCNVSINNENKSINELFSRAFKNNITKYFKNEFINKGNYNKPAKNISVKDPFYPSDKLDIKYIFKLENNNDKLTIENIFNNDKKLKYNFVYSSQILLDKKDNVEKFSNEFKKVLVIILFNLYLIKKNIYENYLKILESLFNNNRENNNNENYNNENNNNENYNNENGNNENGNNENGNNINESNINQSINNVKYNRSNKNINNNKNMNNNKSYINKINKNNTINNTINNTNTLIKKFAKDKHNLEKFKSNISLYEKKKIELNNLEKKIMIQKYLSKKDNSLI